MTPSMQALANNYFITLFIADAHLSTCHQQQTLNSIPKLVCQKQNEELLEEIKMEES